MWWWTWFACSSQPPGLIEPPVPDVPTSPLVFDGPVPTNLLVISLDTTRRDALGRYAPGPSDTPFLDGLLEQSVVLDDHRSCANWTGPSMVCATTGFSPIEARAFRGFTLRDRVTTLATALGAAGYATRLASANPFFFGDTDAIGFDRVVVLDGVTNGNAENVSATLLREIDDLPSPWYGHAHYFDPHTPYCPPPAYRDGEDELPLLPFDLCSALGAAVEVLDSPSERDLLRQHIAFLYAAEVRYWDDQLAALWSRLDADGLLDDTLVVFFTDHGEQRLERDQVGHGFQLFSEETRAAAAFWAKNLRPAIVDAPTVHQDVAATLFDLFELQPAPMGSGRPLARVPAERPLSLVNVVGRQSTLAVVTNETQLTLSYDDERAFHDLGGDPAQLVDTYDAKEPRVLEAWKAMNDLLDAFSAAFPAADVHDRTP